MGCKLAMAYHSPSSRHNFVMINDASSPPQYGQTKNNGEKAAIRRHFFVSRHQGAIEWARKHPWSRHAEFLPHLDLARIVPGDTVIGTLPVHLAAAVCARGAKYLHLSIQLTVKQRGQELTADELDTAGAHLVPYKVEVGHF